MKPEQLIALKQYQTIRESFGIPLDDTVFLSVGEVNENKNHKIVIEALPQLGSCWYVVCGQGPLVEEHKKLAKTLEVGNRVFFAGYRADVFDFYKMADIFVFPSLREGLPVALMEAMAAGLPCVASRNRGTNDLLAGSKLLFDATNVGELTEKLEKALRENFSEEVNHNKNHLKDYDLHQTIKKVKAIYDSVVL